MKLHAYMGDLIQVRGQFNVRVTYKSHTATLPLTVVAGSGPSLMGRNWLTEIRLDWKEIFSVHVSESSISPQVDLLAHLVA